LVLCSVPDQPAARWRRSAGCSDPGARLRFYEHVRSTSWSVGLLEDLITPLWRRSAGGCHPNRDTVTVIRSAGFAIGELRRFGFAPRPPWPRTAHVIGAARAPGRHP
jgi:hypothetical protein